MDQSVWVKALHAHGPSMLNVVVGNVSHENPDDDTENQCMWELIQKKSHKLFQKRVPNPAEEKKLANDIGLQPVPPEIYRKNLSVTQRRNLFYKTLCRKDILYLRVINIRNPYDYKLQLVAKHGNCMRLEDLQIVMYLPKIPQETKFIKDGLCEFEYIRGALWSCSVIERKLFVTLDPIIFEGVPTLKLGKVRVDDLPSSLWCPEIGKSIYDYLINSRVFYKTHLETMLQNVLGVDGNQLYSFFQEWDRKEYPFEETPANFPKLFTCAKSSALLRRSFRLYIVGDIPKAFKYANKALSLDPDAVYTRICRGVLNVQKGSLSAAFEDTKDSLTIDPESEIAKKQMSALLIVAAQKYFERRDFTKLYKTLLVAIGLNPSHFKSPAAMDAFKVVRYIYRMTRDPQSSFPFAPTHQKVLNEFFKKEGSVHRKFVLPPNYEDDPASVAARISLSTQMKQNQRHRPMRSKSGGRRRSSRSCSADRRATSKSRTSEDLQRESRNPDDSSGDPTPNQLRSDGYVGQVVNSRLNKQGHTSNQYLPDNVLNQESTLGRLVNNVDNIAPLHSTPHQQSASGLLRTNPGQNVSIDSVSNQQQDRFISKSNQEVTVHNGSNLPCKDPQNNRKKSGDSILNQSFGPGMLNSNLNRTISIQSEPNKQRALVSCMSNVNRTMDSLSNQERRSETPKSVQHQVESLYSRDIHMQKSETYQLPIPNIRKNDLNQGLSLPDVVAHPRRTRIPFITDDDEKMSTNPNQPFQIPRITANPDVVAHPRKTKIPFINDDDGIVPANRMVSNLNKSPAFGLVSSDSNTLRSSEKQSISIDWSPNQQYVCEKPKNTRIPFLERSVLEIGRNPDVSIDFTNRSGLYKSHTDQRVIDVDTITGPGNFELKKFSSAYSFPNQPHGTGMVTNKTNQDTSIYSTPGQQSGTWMTNLNRGTTVDPKPWQQGGRVIPNHRVVPVFCTGIHELIKTETTINASNKSPTDSSSKELRGVGTSKTNKKRDSTRNQRRGSKSQKSSFHWDCRSNQRRNSTKFKSCRNRVISISKPYEIRNSTKRPSAADESSRPGSWMSNWTRQVSINSTLYKERDCKNQASSSDLEVISVNCVPNEHSRPRMRNSGENEDIWIPHTSDSRRELEDDDVICLYQKRGFSKSRSYRSDDRNRSVCYTCGQSKLSGSNYRGCNVDKRRRSRSPNPDKRRSRSRSSDYRRKQLGSRSHFSSRDRRRNSKSRAPNNLCSRRMFASQFF